MDNKKWLAWALVVLAGVAAPLGVLGALNSLATASDKRYAAGLTLGGVIITACVSLVSERRLRRQHSDEQARLRLDAAINAGALFTAAKDATPSPAAIASGLLALTQLSRADLAVALLVDLWDQKTDKPPDGPPGAHTVSDETAILVLDAALRSSDSNAQLVAAELLCRNSYRLDICQSLHWPSSVDGQWNRHFGVKTKVLIVDALVRMAYRGRGCANLNALQSLAVRLYGISAGDPDRHVKGCVGMLLQAILPALKRMKARSLMQGPAEITIADIEAAALREKPNPDTVFYEIVQDRSNELRKWADECRGTDCGSGALAAATQ